MTTTQDIRDLFAYRSPDEVNTDPGTKSGALKTSVGVMKSLVQIYKELDRIDEGATKNLSNTITNWKKVKDDLMSENVFFTLSDNRWLPVEWLDKGRWHLDQSEMDLLKTVTLLCEKGTLTCRHFEKLTITLQMYSYQKCLTLDMFMDGPMEEAISAGIKNGLTLIIMAENTLFSAAFNYSLDHPIPGMQNILSPTTAMKGIRIIVNEPGAFLDPPDLDGTDVPPGVAATIGLTARKIHHLPHPYTNCSVTNSEAVMLKKAIKRKIADSTAWHLHDEVDVIEGNNSLSRCR